MTVHYCTPTIHCLFLKRNRIYDQNLQLCDQNSAIGSNSIIGYYGRLRRWPSEFLMRWQSINITTPVNHVQQTMLSKDRGRVKDITSGLPADRPPSHRTKKKVADALSICPRSGTKSFMKDTFPTIIFPSVHIKDPWLLQTFKQIKLKLLKPLSF